MTVWRNWIARWTSDPAVAGSNPVTVEFFLFLFLIKNFFAAAKKTIKKQY